MSEDPQPKDDFAPEARLRALFAAALGVADPRVFLPGQLPRLLPEWFATAPLPPRGKLIIVGAGKAAASMAQAIEMALPPGRSLSGVVVTPYGYGLPCRQIEVIEAAHPVPDAAGEVAAQRVLDAVRGLTSDDTVLALMSGGASALLAAPRPGLSLDDKRAITCALLRCGASIHEINCVRKHLSVLKGGQLGLQVFPARLITLALSDVTGDDPAVIGSGPTVGDPTRCADALAILQRYAVPLPAVARRALESGEWETPSADDARLANAQYHLIGSASEVLQKISGNATLQGWVPLVLGDAIEGEAREVARVMAGIAKSCQRQGMPVAAPCLILSGGETTVTLRGKGRGGRNSEFLLAFALALRGQPGIFALAADTDGIDGTEDNAGAVYSPAMWAASDGAARAAECLDDNDAYGWFAAQNGLVVTGPSFTNVNDFRAILVLPAAA